MAPKDKPGTPDLDEGVTTVDSGDLDDATPGTGDASPDAGVTEYADTATSVPAVDESGTAPVNSDEQIEALEHHKDAPPALDSDSHTDDDIAGPAQDPDAVDARHADYTSEDVFPPTDSGDPDVDAFIRNEIKAGTMNVVRARNFRNDAETSYQAARGLEAVRSWDAYLAANDDEYERATVLEDD